jgi:hypothetical protein
MPDTDSDYYNDGPAAAPDAGGGGAGTGKTAMLDKAVCGDCQPGDTVHLKVVAVHGNEVEVSCCADEESGQEPPPEQGGEMQSMLED